MHTADDDVESFRQESELTSVTLLLADIDLALSFCELADASSVPEVKEQRMTEARIALNSVANRLHLSSLTPPEKSLISRELQAIRSRTDQHLH
jgi:hypothetical protein